MSKLTDCLKKTGITLSPELKESLFQKYNGFTKDGIADVGAKRQAVIDLLDQNKKKIVSLYNEASQKAPEVPEEPKVIEKEPEAEERDTPETRRKKGYRIVEGERIDRQDKVKTEEGAEVEREFSDKKTVKGKLALIEADELQPAHTGGVLNPRHFIEEAQPNDRTYQVSKAKSDEIAAKIDPVKLEDKTTNIYTGAPGVNLRNEVVQGNNRSDGIKKHYATHKKENSPYYQYIKKNLSKWGLTEEQFAKFDKPVLVFKMDIDDAAAINLGQYIATDLETGSKQQISPRHTIRKIGDRQENFVGILTASEEGSGASVTEIIKANAIPALKFLHQIKAINDTQYNTAIKNGKVTTEAIKKLKELLTYNLFEGADANIDTKFDKLPGAVKQAIFKSVHNITGKPSLAPFIQDVIIANEEYLKSGLTFKDWVNSTDLFKGTPVSERYPSDVLGFLEKTTQLKTQKELIQAFKTYRQLITGKRSDLFPVEPQSHEKAFKEAFNIESVVKDKPKPKKEPETPKKEPKKGKESATFEFDEETNTVSILGVTPAVKVSLKEAGFKFDFKTARWIAPDRRAFQIFQKKWSKGEPEKPKEDKPVNNSNVQKAKKMRLAADKMQKKIDDLLNPASGQQNPTARRASMAGNMIKRGERLHDVQQKMYAMADMIENGTLPPELEKVSTQTEVNQVLHTKKFWPTTYLRFNELDDWSPKAAKEFHNKAGKSNNVKKDETGYSVPASEIDLLNLITKNSKSYSVAREFAMELKRYAKIGITNEEQFNQVKEALKNLETAPAVDPEVKKQKEAEKKLIGVKIPGFFPTPKRLIIKMIEEANLREGDRIYEPSAGKGDIADQLKERGFDVTVGEINHTLREVLDSKGYKDIRYDFLEETEPFDKIIMNPPFEKGQDMEHIYHGYDLLTPGGTLVSIVSEGPFFRNDKKATEFREWLESVGAVHEKLPDGSFKGNESFRQTGVNTRLITIAKPVNMDAAPSGMPLHALEKRPVDTMHFSNDRLSYFENRGEIKSEKRFSLSNEVYKAIKKYDTIVGEKYNPRGTLGVHFGDTGNILVDALADVGVVMHEMTHRFDRKFVVSWDAKENPDVLSFLTTQYLLYYPNANENARLETQVLEGMAMAWQNYFEAPTRFMAKHPEAKAFMSPGGPLYHSDLQSFYNDLSNVVARYQSLSKLGRVIARQTTGKKKLLKSHIRFKDKLVSEMFDNVHLIEELTTMAGLSWTKDDAATIARMLNNVSSWVMNNIADKKGHMALIDGELQTPYLPFSWSNVLDKIDEISNEADYDGYLQARVQHYSYEMVDEWKEELKKTNEVIASLEAELEEAEESDKRKLEKELKTAKALQKRLIEDIKRWEDILRKDGFDQEDMTEIYNEYKDRYKEIDAMYDKLVAADMKMLYDVGLISTAKYNAMKRQKGYSPQKRDFVNDIIGREDTNYSAKTGKTVSSMIARRGSMLDTVSPVYSSILNHAEIFRKAYVQHVKNSIARMAERLVKNGFKDIFQQVPVESYRSGDKIVFPQEKDKNILMMTNPGGRRTAFLIKDEYLGRVIRELVDPVQVGMLERVAMAASRMFSRFTTQVFPPFLITNTIMDNITALAQTRTNLVPLFSAMKELGRAWTNRNSVEGQLYEEYMMMGGVKHTLWGWNEMSSDEFYQRMRGEIEGANKVVKYLDKTIDVISTPAKYSEIVTRATEYIRARKLGYDKTAAFEMAGRVSVSFHHVGRFGGTTGRAYVRSLPFFNPSLQATRRAQQAASESETRARILSVITGVAFANVLAMLHILKNGSDEQKKIYKSLTPEELAMYLYVPHENGRDLRKLRIPEQMQFIGGVASMAVADIMGEADYKYKDYITASTAFIPDQLNVFDPVNMVFALTPQLIRPAAETAFNKRTFPEIHDIDQYWEQKTKTPKFRYTQKTGEVTKVLSEQLHDIDIEISPKRLEHLILGYMGRSFKPLLGRDIKLDPTVKEYWFHNANLVRDFYEAKNIMSRIKGDLKNGDRQKGVEADVLIKDLNIQIATVDNLFKTYKTLGDRKKNYKKAVRLENSILNSIQQIDLIKLKRLDKITDVK
jgi:hypothetical protein